jgi:hypothetical protein
VPYALRVLRRTRELEAALVRLRVSFEETEIKRTERMGELERVLARDNADAAVVDIRRKDVADAERRLKRLQTDIAMHEQALALADRAAVRRGLIFLGAVVAIALVAFVAWRALRSNPYLPPDAQPLSRALVTAPESA